MKFAYRAKTKEGQLQDGVVDASTREAAIDILQRHNLVILKLETEKETAVFARRIKFFERVKSKEVVIFSRQLSTLFGAKVPLVESLQILSGQSESPVLRDIILDMTKELEGGMALSQSMSKYPKVFSAFYINMVKSGEASGKLEEVLLYLADSLERQYALASKIFNALIYPAFVLVTFIFIAIAMFVWVVPKMKIMIAESGQELPFLTKIVLGFSDFLVGYGLWILGVVIIVGIFAVNYFFRTPEGRLIFDSFRLRAPVFGVLFQKVAMARFADSLSTLITGGLPIVQALEITSATVNNEEYKRIILKTADQVKKGFTISSVLKAHSDIVPPMVTQMIFVGEETGKTDDILKKIAVFYDRETTTTLDTLVSLIEPVMIVGLAGFVFILIAAILLPIYNIANVSPGGV